jgi:predicted  nucleic acid-binding Zn-ribbon protein
LDQVYGDLGAENEKLRDELEEVLEIKQNLENSLKKLNQTISPFEEQAQRQAEDVIF